MDSEKLFRQYFICRALCRYFRSIRYQDIYDHHYLTLRYQVATIPYTLVWIVFKFYREVKLLKDNPKYKKPGLTKEESRLYLSSATLQSFVRTTFRTQKFKQELLTKTISSHRAARQLFKDQFALRKDVSHISVRALKHIEKSFLTILIGDVGVNVLFYAEYHYYKNEDTIRRQINEVSKLFQVINRNSKIKEELIATVFHPDRIEKWQHL